MEQAHICLAESIQQGILIDSLAYIDKEYEEPGMQEYVDSLIQDEMKSFRPKNYLAEWPMPELQFEDSSLLQQEWERVKTKQPLNGFDVSKYTLEEPSGEAMTDEAEWNKSIEIARMQLDYQKGKLENLDLMEQFGSNAWRTHNDDLECMSDKLGQNLSELKHKTDLINQKRKQEQEGSSEKLYTTQWQLVELQMKNYGIQKSCESIEHEVKRKRTDNYIVCL